MDSKGFSFIELTIILGIIASITTTSIIYIHSFKLNNAIRMIYYDLHYVRMKAIKEKNDYRVIFNNTNGHTYQIHDDQNNDGKIDEGEDIINKDIHEDFKGVIFNATFNLTFNQIGNSNSSTITIKNGTDSKQLTVSGTGTIKML